MINSFRDYIEEHKDDIRALEVLYSRPHKDRLTFPEIKELALAIERPPRQWTPENLSRAYEMLDQSKEDYPIEWEVCLLPVKLHSLGPPLALFVAMAGEEGLDLHSGARTSPCRCGTGRR